MAEVESVKAPVHLAEGRRGRALVQWGLVAQKVVEDLRVQWEEVPRGVIMKKPSAELATTLSKPKMGCTGDRGWQAV